MIIKYDHLLTIYLLYCFITHFFIRCNWHILNTQETLLNKHMTHMNEDI